MKAPHLAEGDLGFTAVTTSRPSDGTVLLVDDDQELLRLVSFVLHHAGLTIVQVPNATSALRTIEEGGIDLAILDVNLRADDLGARSGFDLLRDIREISQVTVVMLTARDSEADKVRGLDLGADDYITKPFNNRELVARVRAHLRRQRASAAPALPDEPAPPLAGLYGEDGALSVGTILLNPARHSVTKNGESVNLTVTEFRLLQCLMERASTVVPTRTILEVVWGYADSSDADLVRITLFRLRRKLEDDPAHPRLLHTVVGIGTMMESMESAPAAAHARP